MFKFIFSSDFLYSSIAYAIPLIFAAFAALISKKVGLLSINIEGSMSMAAVTGALLSHFTNSWFVGLLGGVIASILMMMILCAASMVLKTDPFLTGIALNTMATGLAVLILFLVTGDKGTSANFPSAVVPSLYIPFISDIPFIGLVLFSQNLLFYIAIICLVLLWVLLTKTKLGSNIKAVGLYSEAAETCGINIKRTKYLALIIAGLFAGLGGCYLSMGNLSFFSTGMIAGRGFIGIAAEAMANGNPFLAVLFAFLFGMVDYFAVGAQTIINIPYQLL